MSKSQIASIGKSSKAIRFLGVVSRVDDRRSGR